MAFVVIGAAAPMEHLDAVIAWQRETCPAPHPKLPLPARHWHRGHDVACSGCGSNPPTMPSQEAPAMPDTSLAHLTIPLNDDDEGLVAVALTDERPDDFDTDTQGGPGGSWSGVLTLALDRLWYLADNASAPEHRTAARRLHDRIQRVAARTRCAPCALGNHTGTNGTPGCAGDACGCTCRS